jgi:hypothetical protein
MSRQTFNGFASWDTPIAHVFVLLCFSECSNHSLTQPNIPQSILLYQLFSRHCHHHELRPVGNQIGTWNESLKDNKKSQVCYSEKVYIMVCHAPICSI